MTIKSAAKLFFVLTSSLIVNSQSQSLLNPVNVAPRAYIIASSVYQNEYAQFGTQKLVDGLTGYDYTNEWLAQGTLEGSDYRGKLPAWLNFDLLADYTLSGVSLFNTMNYGAIDSGTKDFSIQISSDGLNYSSSILSGTLDWQNTSYQDYQFDNLVSARYVQINLNSAYVNPNTGLYNRVGLKEVVINAVPEPSCLSLLSLGGLALVLNKRRRA